MNEGRNKPVLWTVLIIWLCGSLFGMVLLIDYSARPGDFLELHHVESDHYRLQMFVHPRCPCSMASVRELKRLLALHGKQLDTAVFCYVPQQPTTEWWTTPMGTFLQKLQEAHVLLDVNGRYAASQKVNTSGHVLVYSPQGHCVFSGGITAGRGHEGRNPGFDAVVQCVKHRKTSGKAFPVYGCSISSTETMK